MPANWTITFRGDKLIDATEGLYDEPEIIIPGARRWSYAELIRTGEVVAKPVGYVAMTHSLTVHFHVAVASMAGIITRIQGFCTPVSGSLVIPNYPTLGNCVLDDPGPLKPVRAAMGVTPPINLGAKAYLLDLTLRFPAVVG